jgi:hypothetical protein
MYKNFTLTESEREQILNQHMDHGYKQPMNEQVKQPTGDFTTIGRFGSFDAKILGRRGFTVKGGVATLNSKNVVVKPSQKGWAVYQGGVLKFDLPHDYCDVELDKLIGYNSLQGGYKQPMNEGLGLVTGQECYRFGEVYVCVGDKSEYVMNLQKQLNQSNCQKGLPPISLDGVFGPETKERIMINQKSNCKVPGFNTQQYKRIKTPTGEKYVPVQVSGTNLG